jgi:phosphoglycerate kinase
MPHDLPTLDDLDVAEKRVLVRCDLNVPLADGAISDDLRIRAALPTLQALLARGARLCVCSHLGRPQGRVVEELRLKPVGDRLGDLLDVQVRYVPEVVGAEATKACRSDASVVVLENLRFEPGEEANDPEFARRLAELAEAYVDDAFGAAHRAHASIVGVAELLPSAAGLLLAEEVQKLGRLLKDPARPFVAVLGGAKVSDKLDVIGNLLTRVDSFCIGGAMAFTLLTARGENVGRSLVEHEKVDEVKKVIEEAEAKGIEIVLPSDVVAAESPSEGADHDVVVVSEIGDRLGVDIGPATAKTFAGILGSARTVLWNGPMGIFEIDEFASGTRKVAEAVVEATKKGAYTVVGGGDSAAALQQLGMASEVSHLSTGGGASLELLEGKDLPGIAVLRQQVSEDKNKNKGVVE